MRTFIVGNTYTIKTFLGNLITYKCVKRTAKSIVLADINDNEDCITKRIKTYSNNNEYVVLSAEYMGYCDCVVQA